MENKRDTCRNDVCPHEWILVEKRELKYYETAFPPFMQTIIVRIYRCRRCNREKKEIETIHEYIDTYLFNRLLL